MHFEHNIVKDHIRQIRAVAPAKSIAVSFAILILIGALLLCLPIASNDGHYTNLFDTLFTATSATCVTGLILFDTFTKWSLFGQLVILALIQIGGIGFITFVTFFSLTVRHKIGLRDRNLARESINSSSSIDTAHLLRLVIFFTLCIETIGAAVLAIRFIPLFGTRGIYVSIFTAISAYCNAGFDIFGSVHPFSSVTSFSHDPLVLITISVLVIIGGLGFIVFQDIVMYRKRRKLMFHTKIVLLMSAVLLVVGALSFLGMEYHNRATLDHMTLGDKLSNSFFNATVSRTAGFNSVNLNSLHDFTKLFLILFMFIGGSPGSTSGGIKVTTFAVILGTVFSVITGRDETVLFGRRVDKKVVYRALAIILLSMILVICTTGIILFYDKHVSAIDALFEATSAFGTVGMSTGITPTLGVIPKIALILTMFIGRVGPISFAIALTIKHANSKSNEVLPEGQIIVG